MTTETSATPLPSIVAPGPTGLRSVLFENRDLMGVSLLELDQYRFDSAEVSQDLLEGTSLNCFRCEAARWHTAGSIQPRGQVACPEARDPGTGRPRGEWTLPLSIQPHCQRD